jgi:hypothetical protein
MLEVDKVTSVIYMKPRSGSAAVDYCRVHIISVDDTMIKYKMCYSGAQCK